MTAPSHRIRTVGRAAGFTILELTVVMGLLAVFMMFLLQIVFLLVMLAFVLRSRSRSCCWWS